MIKSVLFNRDLIPWSVIWPDMNNIINMAQKEKLTILVGKAIMCYDEAPETHRRRHEAYENRAITSALRALSAQKNESEIIALYPHPWYREERCEDEVYLADLLDLFLMIDEGLWSSESSDSGIGKVDKLNMNFNSVISLYEKLFSGEKTSNYSDYNIEFSEEEAALLLRVLEKHADTK